MTTKSIIDLSILRIESEENHDLFFHVVSECQRMYKLHPELNSDFIQNLVFEKVGVSNDFMETMSLQHKNWLRDEIRPLEHKKPKGKK